MRISDARERPAGSVMRADVAIVGAGPAGLTLASELANTSLKMLVIESGGLDLDPEVQTFNRVENTGEPVLRNGGPLIERGYTDALAWLNDIPAFEIRNRIVGGSSHTWIGKCAAFDEIDMAKRDWAPNSGWPFSRSALDNALQRAARYLNLGPNFYDEQLFNLLHSPPTELGIDRQRLRDFFWQFSHMPDQRSEPMRFGREIARLDAPNAELLTNVFVTCVNVDRDGKRAVSLDLRTLGGKAFIVEAATIVLCAGGIENARLLLLSDNICSSGLGNGRGVVGRYLADHPRTVIGRFEGRDMQTVASHFGFYGLAGKGAPRFYLRGLRLSPELQQAEGLLNAAAYPAQELAWNDPWIALKRLVRGCTQQPVRDAAAILSSLPIVAEGAWRRLAMRRGLTRRIRHMRLDCMAEQQANPESRVTLSTQRDPLGLPMAKVDWRISGQERLSVMRFGEEVAREFARVGLPRPALPDWIADRDPDAATFSDMAHPSGTTRMGLDPATSVVGADQRVHGIDGLYVAGSSVFPTSGHANPTLMILALTIRLADHLKTRHQVMAAIASRSRRAAAVRA